MAQAAETAALMAIITIRIIDSGDDEPRIEFIPDPDFEGDSDELTRAQHVAMKTIEFLYDECDIDVYGETPPQ